MIRLLLTGLRVSELCDARLKDVRGNRLTVRGKGGKSRTVVLDAATVALLPESASLLGVRPNTVRSRLQRIGEVSGVRGLTPHTFRRTFASLGLLAGMDSRHIRTLGGWSSEKVFSDRYVSYVLAEAALMQAEQFDLTTRLLDRRPMA
jgi:integrase